MLAAPWLKWIVLVLAALALVLVAWSLVLAYTAITSSIALFKDTGFVGLFGSLFGALIGGVIGGGISLYIQSQQSRASAAIKKKVDIYEPLYEALVAFQGHLQRDRHPYQFQLEAPLNPEYRAIPYFHEWSNIKSDSRIIHVPKWIAKAFDQYINNFSEYDSMRDLAASDVESRVQKLLREDTDKLVYKELPGSRMGLLTGIVTNDLTKIRVELAHHNAQQPKGIEIYERVANDIINDCHKLGSVNRLNPFFDNVILAQTEWLLFWLARIIQYISIRYENQDNTF